VLELCRSLRSNTHLIFIPVISILLYNTLLLISLQTCQQAVLLIWHIAHITWQTPPKMLLQHFPYRSVSPLDKDQVLWTNIRT
jgi:hypothetical protein